MKRFLNRVTRRATRRRETTTTSRKKAAAPCASVPRKRRNAAMTVACMSDETRMTFLTVARSRPSFSRAFDGRESEASLRDPTSVSTESLSDVSVGPKRSSSPAPAILSRCRQSRLCLCTRYRTAKKSVPGSSNAGASDAKVTAHAKTVALNACCPGRSNVGRRGERLRRARI